MIGGSRSSFALRPAKVAHPESQLGGLLLGIPCGLGIGWMALEDVIPVGFAAPMLGIAAACLLLAAAVYLVGVLRRKQAALRIEVGPAGLCAPLRRGARRRAMLPLGEIRDAAIVGHACKRVLVTPERGPTLALPTRAFVDPEGAERLVAELQRRIGTLPDAAVRVRRFDAGARGAGARLAGAPRVTLGLSLASLLGFALELSVGAIGSPGKMIALGANHPALVWHGELHRLVTANLLHGSVLHLAANLLVIVLAGSMLERILGWQRFAFVAGISAMGGSAVAALEPRDGYSIGISTLCTGLIGCWGVLNVRFSHQLPAVLRVSRPLALLAVLQFAVYEVVASHSDLSAHVGGLLFGAAAAFAATGGAELQRLSGQVPSWLGWALVLVAAAVLGGLGVGLQRALLDLPRV